MFRCVVVVLCYRR